MISELLSENHSLSDLARLFGVSRKTVYKWKDRFESGGWGALESRSRAPHHQANAIAPQVEEQILALKAKWPLWGAPKILIKLKQRLNEEDLPAESTVSNVLKRHGLTRKPKKRRRAVPSEQPLSHCCGANEVWCADFKGWFRTGDGSKCTPLTITDGYTRYLLRCQGLGDQTGTQMVKPQFVATFLEYGMPQSIRTDNGPPFACAALGGLTMFSVWLMRLGIRLERIEPGKPQQNGRHERMHRTLGEATAAPPERTLNAQQRRFDAFRREYNDERPHEGIDQKVPDDLYASSPREYPQRLPDQRGYPDDWEKRMVRKAGQMKWRGHNVRLTEALWGQQIGLEPQDDGIWGVYFEDLKLGIFDERKMRVIPTKRLRNTRAKS